MHSGSSTNVYVVFAGDGSLLHVGKLPGHPPCERPAAAARAVSRVLIRVGAVQSAVSTLFPARRASGPTRGIGQS
jgi:hypothetical protein